MSVTRHLWTKLFHCSVGLKTEKMKAEHKKQPATSGCSHSAASAINRKLPTLLVRVLLCLDVHPQAPRFPSYASHSLEQHAAMAVAFSATGQCMPICTWMIVVVPHFLLCLRAPWQFKTWTAASCDLSRTQPDTKGPSSFATARKATSLRTGVNLQDHAPGAPDAAGLSQISIQGLCSKLCRRLVWQN